MPTNPIVSVSFIAVVPYTVSEAPPTAHRASDAYLAHRVRRPRAFVFGAGVVLGSAVNLFLDLGETVAPLEQINSNH